MKTTVVVAVTTFALGATVGGVAVATSKPAPAVKACVTPRGVLTLATHGGACAKHTRKVTIATRGPRGANGKPGIAGPGARTSSAASSSSMTVTGTGIAVPGVTLTVSAECSAGEDATASVDLFGPGDYSVAGDEQSEVTNATAEDIYNVSTGVQQHSGLAPSGLVSFPSSSTDAGAHSGIRISTTTGGGGQLAANLLVSDAGHTFSLAITLLASLPSCSAVVQLIPST